MLIYTVAADVPNEDALGLKERMIMDIEQHGDCKVIKAVSDRQKPEQMTMEGIKNGH